MFVVKNIIFKRVLSLLILCVTIIISIPLSSSAAMTTADVTEAMTQLKNSAYPQNYYWCGGNINSSLSYSGCGKTGCSCNSFNRSYQCQGFALYMAQRVIGSYPAYSLSSYSHGATSGSWKCYTKSAMGTQAFCALGLQPGDIVRAAYSSSYSSGHTAVVWKVENGRAYFAEVWGSVYSKINWGGFNYYSYSLEAICSKYSHVALWRNSSIIPSSDVCNHQLKTGYEAAHPHREYTKCSVCAEVEYTGNYVKLDSCLCCVGTHDYTYSFEVQHPHYEIKNCGLCHASTYTGASQTDYNCHACLGLPYNMTVSLSCEAARMGDTVTVDFSAENAVSYNVSVKCDGNKIVESLSTEEKSHTFIPVSVGNYTVTVTAISPEGKVNSMTSEPICVTAPLSSVTEENDKYIFRYDMSLDELGAANFAKERNMLLKEYHEDYFLAEFDTSSNVSEQVGTQLYTYIPARLSYYEILDFCEYTGVEFTMPNSSESNELFVRLCQKSGYGGALLCANDVTEESVWISESGEILTYTNWNPSYKGVADRFKNYLYMYPGGTWVDSVAKPASDYGFVTVMENSFSFIENGNGTLTLIDVPVKESQELSIPSEHNGKAVTAIADFAFDSCNIGTLTIPAGVISISQNAFDNSAISLFCIARDSEIEEFFKQKNFNYIYILPFNDIKKGSWYYDSLYYCYSNNYVSGTSAVSFSPAMSCTREMFVAVLARIKGANTSEYSEASSFDDVIPGKWYSESIEWAYQNGITSGIGDGNFGLGQSVTREQIAVFLYNLAPEPDAEADMSIFTDADRTSDWALDALEWALSVKLVSGTSATTLEPKRTAMRTELCQMIYNYINITEGTVK